MQRVARSLGEGFGGLVNSLECTHEATFNSLLDSRYLFNNNLGALELLRLGGHLLPQPVLPSCTQEPLPSHSVLEIIALQAL